MFYVAFMSTWQSVSLLLPVLTFNAPVLLNSGYIAAGW